MSPNSHFTVSICVDIGALRPWIVRYVCVGGPQPSRFVSSSFGLRHLATWDKLLNDLCFFFLQKFFSQPHCHNDWRRLQGRFASEKPVRSASLFFSFPLFVSFKENATLDPLVVLFYFLLRAVKFWCLPIELNWTDDGKTETKQVRKLTCLVKLLFSARKGWIVIAHSRDAG